MRIEAGGPRIDRIDHDESRRDMADGQHSPERLGKQRAADALTLEGLVDDQAASRTAGIDEDRPAQWRTGFRALQEVRGQRVHGDDHTIAPMPTDVRAVR